MQELFAELKRMRIKDHRNATGIMLRVLIEVALLSFLKDNDLIADACDHCDKNRHHRVKNSDWIPPFRELLSYSVEKRVFPGMTADEYKAIRSLLARDVNYFITIEGFNAFTHNPNMTPTENDLRALWQRSAPLASMILKS